MQQAEQFLPPSLPPTTTTACSICLTTHDLSELQECRTCLDLYCSTCPAYACSCIDDGYKQQLRTILRNNALERSRIEDHGKAHTLSNWEKRRSEMLNRQIDQLTERIIFFEDAVDSSPDAIIHEAKPVAPLLNLNPIVEPVVPKLLYTRRESAKILSLSLRTIDSMISSKGLKAHRKGARVLVPFKELERWSNES